MRVRLVRNNDGEAVSAMVTLTEKERRVVLSGQVPWIYSPGGMGPERPSESATVKFGGACYVDTERCLLACLAAFRVAIAAEFKRLAYWRKVDKVIAQDEEAGFEAFPGGRFADAMRGTKSFPGHPRCPFKQPERAAAWERGYARAHEGLIESFAECA